MNTKPGAEHLVAEAHRHHLAGRLDLAEHGYRAALKASGRNADAARLLGTLLLQRGDAKSAVPLLEKAVRLDPGAGVLVNLAGALRATGDAVGAAAACRRAIALNRALAAAYFTLGHACRDLNDLTGAEEAYRTYVAREPRDVEGFVVLGDTLRLMERPDAAMEAYEAALAYDGAHINAHINIAGIIQSQGFFHAGLSVLEGLQRAAPDNAEARKTLAVAQLQLGDFANGWPGLEARFTSVTEQVARLEPPPPYWRGEDLTGKSIALWTEQGLGDEILFASLIPEIAARASSFGIQCSRRMMPVLQRSFPQASLAARDDDAAAAHRTGFDFQQSIVSLAQYFRPSFAAFPHHSGYLQPDPATRARLREKYTALAKGRRIIGLSWRSINPAFGAAKSAALLNFAPILTRSDTLFVNLQYGDCRAEIKAVREKLGVEILDDGDVDSAISMDDFLAQVAAMDLVISTSNTAAHAAGALNIPVWILLPFAAGSIWYWFLHRADSPWYPSAVLIRAHRYAPNEPWELAPVAEAAARLTGAQP